jgi:hypothetical protein
MMNDGDPVTEHVNAFNIKVSRLLSIDIKISDEGHKCISLLRPLLDSWDNLVVAIETNATTLNFDDVVSSFLSKEIISKTMDSQSTDALSTRGCSLDRNKNKFLSERANYRGRSKSPGKSLRKC